MNIVAVTCVCVLLKARFQKPLGEERGLGRMRTNRFELTKEMRLHRQPLFTAVVSRKASQKRIKCQYRLATITVSN